jgi:ferritin-like metal-binding protein YciE
MGERKMGDGRIGEKLTDYVQDAHAMEKKVEQMLQTMVSSTKDQEIKGMLQHHLEETRGHQRRLEERMQTMGTRPSAAKQGQAAMAAAVKGAADLFKGEKDAKIARDGYTTEHFEIACYELLARLADRAGDGATAQLARQNCVEERRMAEKIDASWDRFLNASLVQEGIKV